MKTPTEAKEEFIRLVSALEYLPAIGSATPVRIDNLVAIVPWSSLRHELDFECWLLGYWSNCWKVSSWDTLIFSYFYRRTPEGVTYSTPEFPPTIRTVPIVDDQAAAFAESGSLDASGSGERPLLPWWLLLSCCTDSAFGHLLERCLYDVGLLPLVLPDHLLSRIPPTALPIRSREEAVSMLHFADPWKFPRVIIPSGLLVSVLVDVVKSGKHEHPRLYDQISGLRPVIDDIEPVLQLLPLIRDSRWSFFSSQAALRTKLYNSVGKAPETFKELIDQAVTI